VLAAGSSLPVSIVYDEGNAAWEHANLLSKELETRGIAASEIELLRASEPLQKRSIVVAVGMGAMKKVPAGGVPGWVGLMVPRASVEAVSELPDNGAILVMDQPLKRIFDLVRIGLPGRNRVGALASSSSMPWLRPQKRLAAERGFEFLVEPATAETMPKVLDGLLPSSDILLALPDSAIHNRNTVPLILLASYRLGIPVVAYSESYLNAGAILALYSTPTQTARQAATMVMDILRGKAPLGIVEPMEFKVGVNDRVARSLGISLPSAAELEAKLR
jgi:ABC-type uncharacterized transport system substrate-binding protein